MKSNTEQQPEWKPVEWVEIPYYPNGVHAGNPTDTGDWGGETIAIPKELADISSYVVSVKGQSMRDFDLHEGDELLVRAQNTAESGEIVIALVNREVTVKTFYEDEKGDRWLIPGNPDYSPIYIGENNDILIQGVVIRIMHRFPRISLRQCAQALNAQRGNAVAQKRAESFPLLTDAAVRGGKGTQVLEALRNAANGTAKDLMSELHHQSNLGYVKYDNISVTQLTSILNNYLDKEFKYEQLRRNRM